MPNNPKKVRCCSLSYCQRDKGKSLSLHSLPQDSIERNQWIQILSINTEVMPKPILVCSRHFNTKDFVTHGTKIKPKYNVNQKRTDKYFFRIQEQDQTSQKTYFTFKNATDSIK